MEEREINMITYGSTTLTSYNTITKIEVYYYQSTSPTTQTGGSWSTTKPTWVDGRYVWQKIRTTYEGKLDNGSYYSESDPVNITGQQGATGTSAYSYKLNASDTIVTKSETGELSTPTITFSAIFKQGTSAVTPYAGRFKIEVTTDKVTWVIVYPTSGTGVDESSVTFTIPENTALIKCSLYQAGGLTVLLDHITIPIVNDGVGTVEPPYKEVEWVESTGKQYVYLDWKPPIKTWGFEIDFISRNAVNTSTGAWNESTNVNGYGTIFGVRNASGVNNCQLSSYNTGLLRIGNGTTIATGFKTDHSRQTIKLQGTTVTKTDGTTATVTRVDENTTKPYCNMAVFGLYEGLRRTSTGNITEPSSTRIYSLKFYDGDTLAVDLVGSIRKADGITGLYDKVSKHFYPAPGMLFGNEVGDITNVDTIADSLNKADVSTTVVNKNRSRMWETSVPFNRLEDGQKITVTYSYGNVVNSTQTSELVGWDDTSSNSNVYLRLIYPDGTKSEWIPCYYSQTARLTTHYGAGTAIDFTYRENLLSNATETTGGSAIVRGFFANASYYQNTSYTQYSNNVKAGTNGIKGYNLIMKDSENTWSCFYSGAYKTTNTGKPVYTGGFILGKILYSAGAGAQTSNSSLDTYYNYKLGMNTSTIYDAYPVDLRYSTNCASTLTTQHPVYIVGTIENDGLFHLDVGQWYTQTEPTYADGKVYVYVGMAYSSYQVWLSTENPAYMFYNGEFILYDKAQTLQNINSLKTSLETQIDSKVETWCQKTNPANSWTAEERPNHTGDLWYYIGESGTTYKNNTTYQYNGETNVWSAYSANPDLFDKIDGKSAIYYGTTSSVTSAEEGDYLVDSTDGSSYRWNNGAWVKVTDYKTAIDNIQIGGRNLARNTKGVIIDKTESADGSRNEYAYFDLGCALPLNNNDDICISFDLYMVVRTAKPKLAVYNSNNKGVHQTCIYTNILSGTSYQVGDIIDERITFVSTITDRESPSLPHDYLEFYSDYGTNNFFRISNLKVEKGNKATDWSPAPEDVEQEISTLRTDLQSQIDEKIQTFYQSTNPALSWTTTELKMAHDGDLWYYTGTTTSTYIKDNVYRYNGSNNTWSVYSASGELFDKVDSKSTIFYGTTSGTYTGVETGDYLVDATDGSSYRYDGSKWVKVTDYQAAIDKIEVGGRNYKRNSNFRDQLNKWSIWAGATVTIDENIENKNWAHVTMGTDKTYGGFSWELGKKTTADPMQIASGDEITISFDAQLIEGEGNAVVWLHYRSTEGGANLSQAIQRFPLTEAITRFSHTFTVPTHSTYTVDTINVMIGIMDGTIKQGRFTNIKVEKGNRSTDWTPAPEDTQADIDQAKNLATAVYGTCSTAADTPLKEVVCENFILFDGVRIQVAFENANSTNVPSLNVNNTGAKQILINQAIVSESNQLLWAEDAQMEFVYDGTYWVLQNAPYSLYGICSVTEEIPEKVIECAEAVICKGTTITVDFMYSNTSDNTVFNVANITQKPLLVNGDVLKVNSRFNWHAGAIRTFYFDGQAWNMSDDIVSAYIDEYETEQNEDGIMVHPVGQKNTGWSIGSTLELLKNGVSYIKMWFDKVEEGEFSLPFIRIGKESGNHVLVGDDAVTIREDQKELAHYSSLGITFDDETPYKIGNDTTYIAFEDTDNDAKADSLRIVADSISFHSNGTEKDLRSELEGLNENIDLNAQAIEQNAEVIENTQKYIQIDPEVPSIKLATNDRNYLLIESNKLGFWVDANETAYMSQNQMNIPTASITNLLMQTTNAETGETIGQIGWVMRTNGHLSLKIMN